MNELIPTIQNRDLPENWNYDKEVAKGKKYLSQTKDGMMGLAIVLQDGHKRFTAKGRSWMNLDVQDCTPKTFKIFCEDIGIPRRTAYWILGLKKEIINRSSMEDFENRLLENKEDNIYRLTKRYYGKTRKDGYYLLNKKDTFPTLKVNSWFYHNDTKREFTLREYAEVQTFPKEFKFIGTYNNIKIQIGNAVAPAMAEYIGKELQGISFADLFAGCGGLSYGLMRLGKKPIWAIEKETKLAMTYKINHLETKIVTTDIRQLDPKDFEEVDIIVGGPPCQGYSLSGKRLKDDIRNILYKEFIRFVEALRPKEFLMENVMGIQSYKEQIIKDFESIGYQVTIRIVKGLEIGMKQRRNRIFFIGKLNG